MKNSDINHPITPPPELVREWAQINGEKDLERFWMRLATQAARWGSDHELEACVEWLNLNLPGYAACDRRLRAARRPNPPSLKKQALEALDHICVNHSKATDHEYTIRRALEQLDD